MNELTIREAACGDLPGLLVCLRELAPAHQAEGVLSNVFLRRHLGACTLVAESDGEIVGTASVYFEPKLLRGGATAGHVEDVAVRGDWQGRGVGRLLVRRCIELCRSRACYKVVLDCGDEVAGFYQSLGFAKAGCYLRMEL